MVYDISKTSLYVYRAITFRKIETFPVFKGRHAKLPLLYLFAKSAAYTSFKYSLDNANWFWFMDMGILRLIINYW